MGFSVFRPVYNLEERFLGGGNGLDKDLWGAAVVDGVGLGSDEGRQASRPPLWSWKARSAQTFLSQDTTLVTWSCDAAERARLGAHLDAWLRLQALHAVTGPHRAGFPREAALCGHVT